MTAAAVFLCVFALPASGQHSNPPASHSAPAPHTAPAPRATASANHSSAPPQNRPRTSVPAHPPFVGYPATPNGPAYPGPPYIGPGFSRPAYPGYAPPAELPRGHLGDWLNQHRNLPVQEQERALRNDPSFHRLPAAEQQRVIQQLHQVDQLTEEQRQRRLARAEIIEHLSPQDRMRINLSARRWAELPPQRQAIMKSAFRDLRALPLNQRQTELNSSRYQGLFSPEERGILTDLLRVEPYQPAR